MVWFLSDALAWDTVGATWPTMPVHYAISDSPDIDEDEVAAITAAFATWEAVECADVRFAYDGRSPTSFGAVDGTNTVSIISSGWPEDPALVSLPSITSDGADMVEVDLAVNAEQHLWVVAGADGRTRLDLQAGITHETGHLLGLWHSLVADATLNPAMAGDPEARTLSDDDIEGLCALYPAGGDGGEAGGRLGEVCTETPDCADGLQCVADAAEQYCAPSCDGGASCPEDYECLPVGADEVCAKSAGCGCATGGSPPPTLVVGALAVLLRRPRVRRR